MRLEGGPNSATQRRSTHPKLNPARAVHGARQLNRTDTIARDGTAGAVVIPITHQAGGHADA